MAFYLGKKESEVGLDDIHLGWAPYFQPLQLASTSFAIRTDTKNKAGSGNAKEKIKDPLVHLAGKVSIHQQDS